jgi:glycosyltransferase involved in cell wall biosynthesis
MLFSIAIPAYTDDDQIGLSHLKNLLNCIQFQSYKNIEIVISDHSSNKLIHDLCFNNFKNLNIIYLKNYVDLGYWGSNMNNAMKNCSGGLIKLMQQDDLLSNSNVLQDIVNEYFLNSFDWAICGGYHTKDYKTFYHRVIPKYTKDIYKGNNKLGGVSSIIIKNTEKKLYFENYLNWMGDCDYYVRCNTLFGKPKIFEEPFIVYKQWSGQFTNLLSDEVKNKEIQIMIDKYEIL